MNSPERMALSRDPASVRQMFDRVADRYDLANHLLSAGCDFFWRERAAEIVASWDPPCLLDVACGTGDLARSIQRKLPGSRITGVDLSAEMLAIAGRKGVRETILADALELPLAGQAFDAVTVAFGLRNMRDWGAALREFRRVLTRNGHLLVLEFSLPDNPAIRSAYRFYLHYVLPQLCRFVTAQKNAYEYLGASIEHFASGRRICDLIQDNGFQNVETIPLTAGIVTIYTAGCSTLA